MVNSRQSSDGGLPALGRRALDSRRFARSWSMAQPRHDSAGYRRSDDPLCGRATSIARAAVLQARVQFTIDILLVTWLIGITNDIHSPYTALYIVIISLASFFLGPRDAIIVSVACAVAFTGCALAVFASFGPGSSQGIRILAVRDDSVSGTVRHRIFRRRVVVRSAGRAPVAIRRATDCGDSVAGQSASAA